MATFMHYTPGNMHRGISASPGQSCLTGGSSFIWMIPPSMSQGRRCASSETPGELANRFEPGVDGEGNPIPVQAPQMRRDPLTGDWIPMATARMNRPITAGPGATATGNPLAARNPGDPYQDGEVPDTDYDVVVFENRFPSMNRIPGVKDETVYVDGNPLWPQRPAVGRCEVVCFDPKEDSLPADLPVSRLRTVVEAWAFRTAEISAMEGIEQIFPFENHGQEIGVSLAHPHGQIYCFPFVAPRLEQELQHTEAYRSRTGGNLLRDILKGKSMRAGVSSCATARGSPMSPLLPGGLWKCMCSQYGTAYLPLTSSMIMNAGGWHRCILRSLSAATCF